KLPAGDPHRGRGGEAAARWRGVLARARRGACAGAGAASPELRRGPPVSGAGRTVLVTGATGFLGKAVVPRLAAAGHRVRMLGRSAPAAELASHGEFVQGDLADRAVLKRALAGVDGLYPLAGRVSFDPADGPSMYRLHVAGTRGLLEEVRARGGLERLVLASTSGTVAVSRTERVATEEDLPPIEVVGRWPYYLSKIYEERLVLE